MIGKCIRLLGGLFQLVYVFMDRMLERDKIHHQFSYCFVLLIILEKPCLHISFHDSCLLFLAVSGLSCSRWALGRGARRFSPGAQPQSFEAQGLVALRSMWEVMSLTHDWTHVTALGGRFLTIRPPGKSIQCFLVFILFVGEPTIPEVSFWAPCRFFKLWSNVPRDGVSVSPSRWVCGVLFFWRVRSSRSGRGHGLAPRHLLSYWSLLTTHALRHWFS